MKRILFVALLLLLVLGIQKDYRLKKVIQLGEQERIAEIVAVNSTTFAVRTEDEVTLFKGPDFQPEQRLKTLKGTSKLSKHGIGSLEESGSFMQFQSFDQNITMMEDGLNSEMLVTSKYALFGKNTMIVPTIIKLDLNTFQKERISYPEVPKMSQYSHALFSDLKNGQIAFLGQYFDLLFLDNETLQIKESLSSDMTYDTRFISVYKDEKKNQSITLIQRGVTAELKRDKTGNYITEQRFNSLDVIAQRYDEVVLTSMDTGVRIFYCNIDYLSNLRSILHVSYDLQYYLKGRRGIAISNDESFFATRNDSGFYEFYRIGQDFSVDRFLSIYLSFNDLKKGKLTSDDKYLFASMTNTRSKNDIAKIDIKEGQFYFITDQFGSSDNQFDFALFHARYNRLVTLEFRGTSYYLQLRSLDSLGFVDEYQLKFDFQIAEYKLISGNDWNLTFGLALRIAPYAYDLENDTKLYMFKIEGDKIISLNISANVSLTSLSSCMKYVLTYKARFPLIRFLHISNLSLAFTIDAEKDREVGIKFQKNIMFLSYYIQQWVFDLSNAPNNIKKVGYLATDGTNGYISFVMADKGMYFLAPTSMQYRASFTKKFFNISSPIVKSNVSLDPTKPYGCPSATYYIPPQKTSPECNFVFYIEYEQQGYQYTKFPQIVRYSQCGQTREKYKVIEYGDYEVDAKIFFSSDKKYVLVLVNPWRIKELLLEIRPIDSMQKIIFHKVFEFYSSDDRQLVWLYDFHVDIIRNNIILIHSPDFITVYFIEPKEFAKDHHMERISHFDVNDRKVVALAGPTLDGSSATNVVVKEIASKDIMFAVEINSDASMIALSPMSENVAVYSKDSTLRVWSISSRLIILNVIIESAMKIEFEGENSIVIDDEEGKRRISFAKQGTFSYSDVIYEPSTIKVMNELIAAAGSNKIEVWTEQKRENLLRTESDEMELLKE